MSLLEDFAAALKARFREKQDDLLTEDGDYAHGNTEIGFWSENIVDMEELDNQIDDLVAEFASKQKGKP
jgi:hypothetical protein